MMANDTRYIPALSFRWLTPLYDPLLKWGMREETFKRQLIAQAAFRPGQRVLDLGCGTGTLTIMAKQTAPGIEITGLDGDPEVLEIAGKKAAQADVSIKWEQGLAFDLPYPNETFDQVISSLMIHHLVTDDKRRAFREVLRVLKPGGEFQLVDFGAPFNPLTHFQAALMKNLEQGADNFNGLLLPMLNEAGFSSVIIQNQMNNVFGPIALIRAIK